MRWWGQIARQTRPTWTGLEKESITQEWAALGEESVIIKETGRRISVKDLPINYFLLSIT